MFSFITKIRRQAAVLALAFASPVWSQTCETVTVTGPPNGAPASWALNGKLTGAAVDLVRQTLMGAGVKKVEFVVFRSWADALGATRTGEVDLIISAGWSSERERYLSFVYPAYASQFLKVIVRKGDEFALNSYTDLRGRVGVTERGVAFGDTSFGWIVENGLDLVRSNSVAESFDRLLAGQVDYVLAYENSAYSEIYTRDLGGRVRELPTYPYRVDTFFAFSRRSKCASVLNAKLSAEIEKANKKHAYFQLNKKYRVIFNESQSAPVPAKQD